MCQMLECSHTKPLRPDTSASCRNAGATTHGPENYYNTYDPFRTRDGGDVRHIPAAQYTMGEIYGEDFNKQAIRRMVTIMAEFLNGELWQM